MSPAAMHLGQTSNLIQIIRKGRSPSIVGREGRRIANGSEITDPPLGLLYLNSGSQEFTT